MKHFIIVLLLATPGLLLIHLLLMSTTRRISPPWAAHALGALGFLLLSFANFVLVGMVLWSGFGISGLLYDVEAIYFLFFGLVASQISTIYVRRKRPDQGSK